MENTGEKIIDYLNTKPVLAKYIFNEVGGEKFAHMGAKACIIEEGRIAGESLDTFLKILLEDAPKMTEVDFGAKMFVYTAEHKYGVMIIGHTTNEFVVLKDAALDQTALAHEENMKVYRSKPNPALTRAAIRLCTTEEDKLYYRLPDSEIYHEIIVIKHTHEDRYVYSTN